MKSKKMNVIIANLSVLLAVIFFGASVTATRAVVQDVSPLILALLRYAIGSAVLFFSIVIFARRHLHIDLIDVPKLIISGAVLFTFFPLTFNFGLQYIEASRGAIILATMPIWSILLSKLSGGENLKSVQIFAVFLAFIGLTISLSQNNLGLCFTKNKLWGDGLLFATACLGAIYGVLAKGMINKYSPLTLTSYAMLFGTILLLPILFIEPLPSVGDLSFQEIYLIIFLGSFGGGLGWYLWTHGLKHLSPTQVTVYVNLNPIVATFLAYFLLQENITIIFMVGFVIILLGVTATNLGR